MMFSVMDWKLHLPHAVVRGRARTLAPQRVFSLFAREQRTDNAPVTHNTATWITPWAPSCHPPVIRACHP